MRDRNEKIRENASHGRALVADRAPFQHGHGLRRQRFGKAPHCTHVAASPARRVFCRTAWGRRLKRDHSRVRATTRNFPLERNCKPTLESALQFSPAPLGCHERMRLQYSPPH